MKCISAMMRFNEGVRRMNRKKGKAFVVTKYVIGRFFRNKQYSCCAIDEPRWDLFKLMAPDWKRIKDDDECFTNTVLKALFRMMLDLLGWPQVRTTCHWFLFLSDGLSGRVIERLPFLLQFETATSSSRCATGIWRHLVLGCCTWSVYHVLGQYHVSTWL